MVLDQPRDPWRDGAFQGSESRLHVVERIDRLAHIVEQGGGQELLVVRAGRACVFEDLEAVVQRVPLGVPFRVLLDGRERFQTHLVNGKSIDVVGQALRWLRLFLFFARNLLLGGRVSIEREPCDLLTHLGVRGEVSGSDGVAQNGRRPSLGCIQLGFACEADARFSTLRSKRRE